MTIRVFIAVDHDIMRAGLRSLLEKEPDIQVIGEASNGRQAVEMAKELAPNIVIMDVGMSDLNGIDATRQIVKETPHTKILALSMHSDRRFVLAMLKAGASGYLIKKCAHKELVHAIHTVAADQFYLSPAVADVVVDELVSTRSESKDLGSPTLTAREREILQLLAEGNATKQIATHLHISASTVETHRRQLMDKLNIHDIANLTKYAIREGLTTFE